MLRIWVFTKDARSSKRISGWLCKTEWSLDKIKSIVKTNRKFAEGIVNLFFRGPTVPVIKKVLPLFEFKNFSVYLNYIKYINGYKIYFDFSTLVFTVNLSDIENSIETILNIKVQEEI